MNREDIFRMVSSHCSQVLPELENHDFQRTDRLSDLGANSVDRAEIVMMAMESLSLNIPRLELYGVKNIGELADVLYEKSQAV